MIIKPNWKYIILRLGEAGTYRSLAWVSAGLGFSIPDPIANKIGLVCAGVFGLIGAFMPELGSPVTVEPSQITQAIKDANHGKS